MTSDLKSWRESGEYLPPFMRDFHDQKDLFKAIHDAVERRNASDAMSYTKDLGWITAQIYTVDFFLWIMAGKGYTLQRSRKHVEFGDVDAFVATAKKQRDAEMAKILGL